MTTQLLHVTDDGTTYEIFINHNGKVYIGEVGDENNISFVTISHDDWQVVKKFIDNQFKQVS